MVGGLLLLALVHRGSEVVLCGLAYAWLQLRGTSGDISTEVCAKTAMIGGFVGGLVFDVLRAGAMFSTVSTAIGKIDSGARVMDFIPDAFMATALANLASLVLHVFLLGLAIRVLAPALPKEMTAK